MIKDKTYHLIFFVFCFLGGVWFLIDDIYSSEEEIYNHFCGPRNFGGKGTGLFLQQVCENWGNPGIIFVHCLFSFGTSILCLTTYISEVKKDRKIKAEKKQRLSQILEMFNNSYSLKSSDIMEEINLSESEVMDCLQQLVEQKKIIKMGNDEYWKYEEV